MPPLVSKFKVEEELAIFPEIRRDPCYSDFVKIGVFLSDRDAVIRGLQDLEKKLYDKGKARWYHTEDFLGRLKFYDEEKIDFSGLDSMVPGMLLRHFDPAGRDYKDPGIGAKKSFLKHLFSSTLTDLEVAHEFDVSKTGGVAPRRAQYYLAALDADVFRRQILLGRPPGKDPFVDVGHGEFTHRLQWYAIMSPTSPIHLDHPVIQVYRAVGAHVAPEGHYEKSLRWGLWDALCDRDNGTASGSIPFQALNERDFRCPNCLNTFLVEEGLHHDLPLIGAFLKGRLDKRTRFKERSPHKGDPLEYAALKVYGKPTKLLSIEEQISLQDKLGTLQGVWDSVKGWR